MAIRLQGKGGISLAHPAMAGVAAALHRGEQSFAIQLVSDSTGDDSPNPEWFSRFGLELAPETHTVGWELWNTTTQDYNMPVYLQQGTANGGGKRGTALVSGALRRPHGTATTSDQDIVVNWTPPAAGWKPGGAAANRTLLSRWTTTGSGRVWKLDVTETGVLRWWWSTDGAAESSVVSTAAVPFNGTTEGWIKVTHDVNNGASGHTVAFYTSTDGETWTALGTPVVTATAITLHSATTDYLVGAWFNAGVPAGFSDGTFHRVEVRPGTLVTTNGTRPGSVVPHMVEDWDQATTAASVSLVGAPVITMRAGAASGQSITYFDDSTRRFKILSPAGQLVIFLSTGHNEGNTTAFMWQQTYNTWITNVKSRIPYTPIVTVTQNPATSAASGGDRQRQNRATRGVTLASLVASLNGVYYLDTYPAFTDMAADVESDGTHPTAAGSLKWGKFVKAKLLG
jgi:lysophospholipase L1-like esterase